MEQPRPEEKPIGESESIPKEEVQTSKPVITDEEYEELTKKPDNYHETGNWN
ncbi:MAG: hypothetical protein KBB91_03165 [Candidatus Pacebacteria bacterium]|jgi:hypothetical protein|nr:hypothetical protein [Candidatus Paceibacterota bacterium]